MNALVTYFSASGVTKAVAERLARGIHAQMYEIAPETPYSDADLDWTDKQSRSTLEMQDPSARPALRDHNAPVGDFEIIFIGFPIWWYREPSIIDSFLEAYDFTGKTIIPFATSGGSALGKAPNRIAEISKAKMLPGKLFTPKASERELKDWVRSLPI